MPVVPAGDASSHRAPGIYALVNHKRRAAWVGQSLNCAYRTRQARRDSEGWDEAWLLVQIDENDWDQEQVGDLELAWMLKLEGDGWTLANESRVVNPFGGAVPSRAAGKKGGAVSGPANIARLTPDQLSEAGKKGAPFLDGFRGTGRGAEVIREWTQAHPEHQSVAAKAARARGNPAGANLNKLRYRCLECDRVMSPGSLGSHQKASGHVGKERVQSD